MPPVAFGGDTDPRRWGVNSVSDAAVIGAEGTHNSIAIPREGTQHHQQVAVLLEKGRASPPLGALAPSGRAGAGAALGRPAIDGSHQHQQGFGAAADGRSSPLPMEPRIVMDSNGGGAQQQASPYGGGGGAGSFDHHPHHPHPSHHPLAQQQLQQQHGDEAGPAASFGMSRMHGPSAGQSAHNSSAPPRGPPPARQQPPPPPPPPPQQQQLHRSFLEDAGLMHPDQQYQHQQNPLGRPPQQGLDLPNNNHGPGPALSRGRNVGGAVGVGHHGMGLGAAPSWQGQQQQQQQHRQQQQQQQQPMRGSSPGGGGGRLLGSKNSPPAHSDAGSFLQQRRASGSPEHHHHQQQQQQQSSLSMAALASVPHGASALPASAVPTVLERFPGFVRCVMDIAPEVVGWVIGRSGAHIKEMKHRSGCGMWVDQKDLKLYITGADMPRIHAAAALVGDLISKAPVNVNSAGVEDEVTSHMIECPPHLIGLLIGRGGSTIKRIKEESRANVVINQKMMKVIVSGIPQSVRLGVAMIEDVITFGRSAEHGGAGLGGAAPPNFLDFPGVSSFGEIGGIPGMAEFIDDGGGPLDRFTTRSTAPPSMFPGDGGAGGRGLGVPSLSSIPSSGDPGSNLSAGGSSFPAAGPAGGSSPFDGGGPGARQQHQVAAGGGGGGQPAEMEMDMSVYDGKDLDWSVFSASPSMFNISGGAGGGGGPDGSVGGGPQSQSSRSQQGSPGAPGAGGGRGRDVPHQHPLLGLPPPSSGRPILGKDGSGEVSNGGLDVNTQSHGSRSSSLGGGGGGSCGVLGLNSGSRTGSFSSAGTGTPPLAGRSMATAPWNIMGGPPVRSIDGGGGGGAPPRAAESSPRAGMPVAGTLAGMKKLSITSDDSNSGVRSLGQANRQRERSGTPVGNPADLAEFLGNMGLAKYAQTLTENEIDLEAVQLMAEPDFEDIGIPKGPRVKLLYALKTRRHPPMSGDLSAMVNFLTSLGLEKHCGKFEEEEVDMGAVDIMEESDYKQLGVAKGPRLKMMNALARSAGGAVPGTTIGSFTSAGSVGGGSNAGSASASIPSPELRSSPLQHQANPNPASLLSPSHWSFPVGGGEGNSSSGSTPRLGGAAEGEVAVAPPATARAVLSAADDVGVDVSNISLAGDEEVRSSASGSSGAAAAAAAAGGEASSEGGVADAGDGSSGSRPADADIWVVSARSNVEDGGDGSP
eukprot:g7424.t1